MNTDLVENRALKFGVFMSLVMAAAGWVAYYYSGSEATLLDGNFSFISALATVIALIIAKYKHKTSDTFPFGSYVFEALFVLIKGILIFGVIIMAVVQNASKIIAFIKGAEIEPVKIDTILIYVAVVSVLCFVQYMYYHSQNKRINGKSPILKVETQGAMVDGFLSVGIGIVFLGIMFIPENSPLDFLKSIGDAIIVLIIGILFMGMPVKIIRDSFIEMGGGTLQDKSSKELIEETVEKALPKSIEMKYSYITKLGSSYFVAVFVSFKTETVPFAEIDNFRTKCMELLSPDFNNLMFEVIIRNNADKMD